MRAVQHTLFLMIFFFGNLTLFSQNVLWEKSLGGKHIEYLTDAVPTADYGFILAGSSLSDKTGKHEQINQGDYDFWIWKMDEFGDPVWQRSYGGNGLDLLKVMKKTPDGGFILGGTSTSKTSGDKKEAGFALEDLWIIKLNAAGDEDWQITLGGLGADYLMSLEPTKDGGFVVGATSSSEAIDHKNGKSSAGFGGLDYWVIKLDKKGNIVWQKTFGGIFDDRLTAVVEYELGKYVVAGTSNSSQSGNRREALAGISDFWLVFLDENGAEEQQISIGGDLEDELTTLLVSKDGSLVLGGNSNSDVSLKKRAEQKKGTDFWLVKMKTDGEILWQETYNIAHQDKLISMVENPDLSLVLSGYAVPKLTPNPKEIKGKKEKGEHDFCLIKTDGKGKELWRKIVGSDGTDRLHKTIITRDGGYLLAGTSDGGRSKQKSSESMATDFWVVKLKDEEKHEVERANGLEAFPNPASNFVNVIISFEYESGSTTLYNIQGTVLQKFNITDRTIPFDLSNYPAGVYIAEVNALVLVEGKPENRRETIKIMKSSNQ
ncbi:MAG: T9SS type A sorting domain-containing protein [Flavobacterium sp.]